MARFSSVVLVVCAFALPVSAMYGGGSSVVTLTVDNFKSEVMKSNSIWMVEFYAPWCGHCKSLAPEWEKAAKALKGVVKIGAVDATVHEKLGSKYGVKGFPTIKVFGAKKRSPTDYQGARTSKAIVEAGLKEANNMVRRRAGLGAASSGGSRSSSGGGQKKRGSSDVVELGEDNFDDLVLGSNDMWMVEFFAPWCGHCKALAPEWEDAATKLKGDVKLGAVDATVHGGLAQRFGVKGYPTIKWFGAGPKDASGEDYQQERKSGAIVDFAMATLAASGVEPEIDEMVSSALFDEKCGGKTICVVAALPDLLDGGKAAREGYLSVMQEVAKTNRKGPFKFMWSAGGSQPAFEKAAELNFGFPALVAVNQGKLRYAVHRGVFNAKKIGQFLSGIMSGRTRTLGLDGMPSIETVTPWDGSDATAQVEEEFSLDDIMGDD